MTYNLFREWKYFLAHSMGPPLSEKNIARKENYRAKFHEYSCKRFSIKCRPDESNNVHEE